MKRGQLSAVIIIVLLVAAVGGFVIFSEKKAGRAFLSDASISPEAITVPFAATAPLAATSPYTPTAPPAGSSTTSSEIITGTTECKVISKDCVSYVKKGEIIPDTLCAHTDDLGCYHSYACTPYGELVQKETPAFCGMVGPGTPSSTISGTSVPSRTISTISGSKPVSVVPIGTTSGTSGGVYTTLPTAVLTVSGAKTFTDADLFALLEKYKPFFSAHKDLTAPAGERTYVLEPGVGNVLLTAPHAVNHIREGFTKINDFCTGPMVKVLKDMTGASIMYLQYKSADPNFYNEVEFKYALADYLTSHPEIKLVIDVHGAAGSHDFDVDLGDRYGKSLIDLKDLPFVMEDIFKKHGISIISHNFFSADDQLTVTKFVSDKAKRNAIQSEINKKYRCSGTADDIVLLRSLEETIKKYQ